MGLPSGPAAHVQTKTRYLILSSGKPQLGRTWTGPHEQGPPPHNPCLYLEEISKGRILLSTASKENLLITVELGGHWLSGGGRVGCGVSGPHPGDSEPLGEHRPQIGGPSSGPGSPGWLGLLPGHLGTHRDQHHQDKQGSPTWARPWTVRALLITGDQTLGTPCLLVQVTPGRPGRLLGPETPGASAAGSSLGRTPSPWTPSCCSRPRLTGAVLTLVLPADQVRTTGRGPSRGGCCPWPEERGERGQRREVPLRLRTSFASSSPSSSRPSAFSFFHLNSSRS